MSARRNVGYQIQTTRLPRRPISHSIPPKDMRAGAGGLGTDRPEAHQGLTHTLYRPAEHPRRTPRPFVRMVGPFVRAPRPFDQTPRTFRGPPELSAVWSNLLGAPMEPLAVQTELPSTTTDLPVATLERSGAAPGIPEVPLEHSATRLNPLTMRSKPSIMPPKGGATPLEWSV